MSSLATLIAKLDATTKQALEQSVGLCLNRQHFNVELSHWLKSLSDTQDGELSDIIRKCSANPTKVLQDLDQRLEQFKKGNDTTPAISQRVIELINEAWLFASLEQDGKQINTAMLLYVLLENTTLQQLAFGLSSEFEKVDTAHLKSIINDTPNDDPAETAQATPNKHALSQFATNLNEQAKQGKIDPVIGREDEIRKVIDILSRRRQNNAILTGEPGVGKTAIVEGLALLITQSDVPDNLKEVTIYSLDLGLLQAGASMKGEFENRLKSLIQEVKSSAKPIILFIDEAHTLIGSGGAAGQNDAANLLKPALARGDLRSIAATTWNEYKKYFETDPALTRRFQVVKVEEPNTENAIRMLRSLTPSLETHHKVHIEDHALKQAVNLSKRYIQGRLLPDKAISVLDTACARVSSKLTTTPPLIEKLEKLNAHLSVEQHRYEHEIKRGINHKDALKAVTSRISTTTKQLKKLNNQWEKEKDIANQIHNQYALLESDNTSGIKRNIQSLQRKLNTVQTSTPLISISVDTQAIAEVIADWTGIPTGEMVHDEADKLLNLEQRLMKDVTGQDDGLRCVSRAIKAAGAKIANPDKPYGVFLLVGPSGVGKTETALSLAQTVYGSRDNITVINMSEFKEEHKVSMLAGSPPGYVGYGEGGVLTEAVRRQPYSLILLDEIEKAHPGIQDVFYQVFDKGNIKDGQGRDIDFKNTIIIMTSNACSELISSLCEDDETRPNLEGLTAAIQDELLKHFKPAFLGRVTVVPYLPLEKETLKNITSLKLDKVVKRIATEYKINLEVDDSLKQHVTESCNQSNIGARQIDNILNQEITPLLSEHILSKISQQQKLNNIVLGIDENKKPAISEK